MFVQFCLLLLGVGARAATVADCPSVQDPTQMKIFENTCYQFVLDQQLDFDVAEQYCAQKGGTLAMPKTQPINDFLVTSLRFSFYFNGQVWFGLDDRTEEDTFKWADGTTLVFATDYTNWADENGHRAGSAFIHGFEDCAYLDTSDGLWYDSHCKDELVIFTGYRRPFICEYKI